jgi:hypothetical protein
MRYVAGMTGQDGDGSSTVNSAELQAFAARFIDLWQRQLETMAADPALRDMMAATSQFAPPAPGASEKKDENGTSDDSQNSGNTAPDGAAAAAASSRRRGIELDELARRVAACEERLADLEKRAKAPSGSARKRSRKAQP